MGSEAERQQRIGLCRTLGQWFGGHRCRGRSLQADDIHGHELRSEQVWQMWRWCRAGKNWGHLSRQWARSDQQQLPRHCMQICMGGFKPHIRSCHSETIPNLAQLA